MASTLTVLPSLCGGLACRTAGMTWALVFICIGCAAFLLETLQVCGPLASMA